MKLLILTISSLIFANSSYGQVCGQKSVSVVVPAGAGASADFLARKITASISRSTGASIIVDNKGGAAGNIGAAYVKNLNSNLESTLLFCQAPEMVINPYVKDLNTRHAASDFKPIAYAASIPYALVCNIERIKKLGIPIATDSVSGMQSAKVGDLTNVLKTKSVDYCHGGVSNFTNLAMIQLAKADQFKMGTDAAHGIPYKETSAAFQGVMNGDCVCMFHSVSSVTTALNGKPARVIQFGTTVDHDLTVDGVTMKPIAKTFSGFGDMQN